MEFLQAMAAFKAGAFPYSGRSQSRLLTFHCNVYQARTYFFKFGAEAEVLAPTGLRREFAEGYQKAVTVYHKGYRAM